MFIYYVRWMLISIPNYIQLPLLAIAKLQSLIAFTFMLGMLSSTPGDTVSSTIVDLLCGFLLA